MEPKILMIGRRQSVLDELQDILQQNGRRLWVSVNSKENIQRLIQLHAFDFVVMGAGLPAEERHAAVDFIESITPKIPVHLMPKEDSQGPKSMIAFTNQHAEQFKKKQSQSPRERSFDDKRMAITDSSESPKTRTSASVEK